VSRSRARGSEGDAVRAFGAYVRLLREHADAGGRSRGKTLRQLARETGIAPSVLSRGERGLQDLRRPDYLDRLAPPLGIRPSVLRRVAAAISGEDALRLRPLRSGAETSALPRRVAQAILWARLRREVEALRDAPAETLEAVLSYLDFLASRGGNR